jgi:hypothetical protein
VSMPAPRFALVQRMGGPSPTLVDDDYAT